MSFKGGVEEKKRSTVHFFLFGFFPLYKNNWRFIIAFLALYVCDRLIMLNVTLYRGIHEVTPFPLSVRSGW